ncbi:unnamed protein product [Vitrella brassicaformis CCMP3155]|uniref:Uncharacterized protein n=1 Tax=Vitrella brassicaformis (strain CCMP3155) TaxID=1169540 RepID=A0A0G4EUH1_VITBC|nr:unnamed protein product [Vitrella brassicaformis CCMP3155]|eukprot:CEM01736.1 unnamed protein product [Vitrella brassicaformis CCMP3155]
MEEPRRYGWSILEQLQVGPIGFPMLIPPPFALPRRSLGRAASQPQPKLSPEYSSVFGIYQDDNLAGLLVGTMHLPVAQLMEKGMYNVSFVEAVVDRVDPDAFYGEVDKFNETAEELTRNCTNLPEGQTVEEVLDKHPAILALFRRLLGIIECVSPKWARSINRKVLPWVEFDLMDLILKGYGFDERRVFDYHLAVLGSQRGKPSGSLETAEYRCDMWRGQVNYVSLSTTLGQLYVRLKALEAMTGGFATIPIAPSNDTAQRLVANCTDPAAGVQVGGVGLDVASKKLSSADMEFPESVKELERKEGSDKVTSDSWVAQSIVPRNRFMAKKIDGVIRRPPYESDCPSPVPLFFAGDLHVTPTTFSPNPIFHPSLPALLRDEKGYGVRRIKRLDDVPAKRERCGENGGSSLLRRLVGDMRAARLLFV